MAWTKKTIGSFGDQLYQETGLTAAAAAGAVYSPEMQIPIDANRTTRYISVLCEQTGSITSASITVALWVAFVQGGQKFKVADNIVTALTNAAKTQGNRLDLNAYPAPYYYIGYTSTANDSAASFKTSVYIPQIGGLG
jgi:hypothetical protein